MYTYVYVSKILLCISTAFSAEKWRVVLLFSCDFDKVRRGVLFHISQSVTKRKFNPGVYMVYEQRM